MLLKILKVLTSLRLTVVCLALATVLVFIGTLAQVDEGLYQAQARYFKSFWIVRPLNLPIGYPGGYLIGMVLMVNLLGAHSARFKLTRKKAGLFMIHIGIILLLAGQLLTDVLSRESSMRLAEGETKSYSESFRENELALVDTSDPQGDSVISIPEQKLVERKEFQIPQTPFTVRVKNYWPNSMLSTNPGPIAVKADANKGLCTEADIYVFPLPQSTKMDERSLPAAVVEISTAQGSIGSWLVSPHINEPQSFSAGGKTYNLALRFARHYLFAGQNEPFRIHLLKFDHDLYRGTEVAKNFSSRIRLQNPATGEDREVLIKMNSPLRYKGETFYQASFDPNDRSVTVLEVVHNPSWLTPYLSCLLVGAGLVVQFLSHLFGFIKKRRLA
jgi:ResB-like family protein